MALRDVFSKHILKDDRKLEGFQFNPSIKGRSEDDIAKFELVEAYYSHGLKELYREFVVNILADCAKDNLEYYRKLALEILLALVSNSTELHD